VSRKNDNGNPDRGKNKAASRPASVPQGAAPSLTPEEEVFQYARRRERQAKAPTGGGEEINILFPFRNDHYGDRKGHVDCTKKQRDRGITAGKKECSSRVKLLGLATQI